AGGHPPEVPGPRDRGGIPPPRGQPRRDPAGHPVDLGSHQEPLPLAAAARLRSSQPHLGAARPAGAPLLPPRPHANLARVWPPRPSDRTDALRGEDPPRRGPHRSSAPPTPPPSPCPSARS